MEARNSKQARREATATPPHPVLEKWYSRPADRQVFVRTLFDSAAKHYNHVGRMLDLGSGERYRRETLRRAGLRPGMRLLDVATGTGLVAKGAAQILGKPGGVVGVDPSQGMLKEARKVLAGPLVQGTAEALPFRSDRFDMLSMGFALRHVADLEVAFREYWRVLKPDGRLLLLETVRPTTPVGRWFIRFHFQRVLPFLARITTRSEAAQVLMDFYWDTIDQCVPPETILEVLQRTGFVATKVQRTYVLVYEYVATKPLK
jgi:demethylmenaquinone methyltransferase / 2-methoxy-6-polyprenyl-1,4-benzoquinol methylase